MSFTTFVNIFISVLSGSSKLYISSIVDDIINLKKYITNWIKYIQFANFFR